MATVADSLKRSSINIQNISKSLSATKESVTSVNDSVGNISRIITTNAKIKRDLFSTSQTLIARREEASQRREREDAVEASQVSTSTTRGFAFSSKSDKGPLGRLLGFLGFITAGWIVENLPTWIFMGKEFISRIQTFGRAMYDMVDSMQLIIKSFGDVLKNSFNAIVRLDFNEFSEGSVAQSFDELNSAVQGLGDDITETFRLFTTPLTEALETGEQAPGLGETREDKMFPDVPQEPGAPSRVTGTAKQALDIISKYESQSAGGYEAVNQIGIKGGYGTLGYSGSFGGMKQHKGQKLTQMSVGEIMELQRDIPGMSNAEWIKRGRLHAVGRYQIIGSTLKGLVDKGVIKPSDKFDETTQDIAGMYILKTSGIGAYYGPKAYATSQERAIIEKARREPVSYATSISTPQTPLSTNFSAVRGTSGSSMGNNSLNVPYSPFKPGSGATITSGMGLRWGKQHRGYDLAAKSGTPLYAYFPGKVTHIGLDGTSSSAGYGNWVVWQDNVYGAYHFFGHMLKAPSVKVGDPISQGTLMGYVGSTGESTGPHLHWEISSTPPQSNGQFTSYEDPGSWLRKHPLKKQGQSSAEISAQPRSQQPSAITPDRKGSQIMIIDDTQPQVSQVSYQSAPQPSYTPTISEFRLLNNFIKNKLLIDLAYL